MSSWDRTFVNSIIASIKFSNFISIDMVAIMLHDYHLSTVNYWQFTKEKTKYKQLGGLNM